MVIFVHDLSGEQQAVNLANHTIESLQEMLGLPTSTKFVCEGRILSTFEGVQELANVYVTAGLDGGKKKKKKKQFTGKKKGKHIHKKIKGLTLSLYSVDGAGNVTYQKKNCPKCGPGTFMAKHWDRYYCGSCTTTIKMDPETIKRNE